MTRRVGDTIYLEGEPDAPCDFCGAVTELRPAGPGGEELCVFCAKRDPAAFEAYMGQLYAGLDTIRVITVNPN